MKKMAVRGLTVMCSAGDAGWTDVGFGGNDLSGASVTSCDKGQAPIFPASSPYVTSVGSHFLTSSGTMVASSVRAGKSWTTGGGFAGLSPTPAYQSAEVSHYLKSTPEKPQPGLFNEGGRAYPDLSLIGDNIECVMNGRIFPLQGTSSSGPIAAGLFALINDARLNAGMSPLGFLNPSLYRWHQNNTQAFSDVTQGFNNDGLVQPPYTGFPAQCDQGFAATKGWDAVSGLGAPVFPPLLKLALEQR
jgi:tripeptidyl-peptidase-1